MMDEMETLAKRIATGRPARRKSSMPSTTGKQIAPEEMKKMRKLGSRMSDRLIGRFK